MQMADKIVLRSVESLIPYARNARIHSDAQVAQIAGGSIREFGFTFSWGPSRLRRYGRLSDVSRVPWEWLGWG